jgi:hypothetical protein
MLRVKRAVPLVGGILTVGLLATGCTGSVAHVAGDAAPVTAAPTTSLPVPAPAVTSPPGPASLILGPAGLGPLKLGMTRAQASATGLIGAWTKEQSSGTEQCWRAVLKGSPVRSGYVSYNDRVGVASIWAIPGMRTPEGIELGATSQAMLRAYPDWKNSMKDVPPTSDGQGFAAVPGNEKAVYRITTGGIVAGLTLQDKNHGCYAW